MIQFKNGYKMDFACASGALAFNGDGYYWEQPARWLGWLKPQEFTIITKTLTFVETKGNLRWWCPWRCVRLIPGGAVNSVGLTNPGYLWWINNCYQHIIKRKYNVIVSTYPKSAEEAHQISTDLQKCSGIVGIQVNLSCPNIKQTHKLVRSVDDIISDNLKIIDTVIASAKQPVSVKLAYQDHYLEMCQALETRDIAFIELINTVPYGIVFPGKLSPLAKYGLEGGVSGKPIIPFAREALTKAISAGIKTPIASGGGINSPEEVYARHVMGAKACVLGVSFLRNISKPNQIVKTCRAAFRQT
jgi:dihydroorotate dehydrogenase (NAD+) catalytic subunit